MFKRIFWMGTGMAVGAGGAFWAKRKVEEAIERYLPEQVAVRAAESAKGLGDTVRQAATEGREAMRSTEAELRRPGRGPHVRRRRPAQPAPTAAPRRRPPPRPRRTSRVPRTPAPEPSPAVVPAADGDGRPRAGAGRPGGVRPRLPGRP